MLCVSLHENGQTENCGRRNVRRTDSPEIVLQTQAGSSSERALEKFTLKKPEGRRGRS